MNETKFRHSQVRKVVDLRMQTDVSPILKIRNVSKTFGATKALVDVSLDILKGEVHAIVGSNGAGKSTMMKVLSGLYVPESGTIEYEGVNIVGQSPLNMQHMGIQTVHQALNIVGSMTVLENILLSNPPMKHGMLNWKAGMPKVLGTLKQIDFPLDLKVAAQRLSVSEQQFIILARAIINGAKVLILDEPTARLGLEETNKLFALIRRLKEQGTTILYISHRMEEIYTISDRISVFRDGRLVCTENTADFSEEALVSAMLGKKLNAFFPKAEAEIGKPLLTIRDLRCAGRVNGVDLTVHSGEIVSLIGAVGAGKTEIVNSVFGIQPIEQGEVELDGKKLDKRHTPRKAIQAGVALVPEDRAQQGMIGDYAVRENISSIDIQKASSHGVLSRRKEDRLAQKLVKALDVRPADIHYPMTGLSGGNQQKVVVGKWLTHDYGIYLMDEVTSGVDIEAKAAIYTIMGDIVKKGGAVLNSTGDIEEALGVSDRILVLFKGKVILETTPDKTSKEQLLAYIMGGEASA